MNDNELNFKNNTNIYHASTNLNTAIENPNVDIDNATDVNIQNNLNNTLFNDSSNIFISNDYDRNISSSNIFIPNVSQDNLINDGNNQNNVNFNNTFDNGVVENKVNYVPTIKKKKKPSSGLVLPNEVKAMVVIIVILLIVLFVIPYVYDFFKELNLAIMFR